MNLDPSEFAFEPVVSVNPDDANYKYWVAGTEDEQHVGGGTGSPSRANLWSNNHGSVLSGAFSEPPFDFRGDAVVFVGPDQPDHLLYWAALANGTQLNQQAGPRELVLWRRPLSGSWEAPTIFKDPDDPHNNLWDRPWFVNDTQADRAIAITTLRRTAVNPETRDVHTFHYNSATGKWEQGPTLPNGPDHRGLAGFPRKNATHVLVPYMTDVNVNDLFPEPIAYAVSEDPLTSTSWTYLRRSGRRNGFSIRVVRGG